MFTGSGVARGPSDAIALGSSGSRAERPSFVLCGRFLQGQVLVVLLHRVVLVEMLEHVCQLADLSDGLVQLLLQVLHFLVRIVPVIRQRVGPALRRLHLGEHLARLVDVIDRADDLAHLLLVLVLVLDLILKVKLQRLVLPRDILYLRLQRCHMALLPVQLLVKLLKRLLLLFFDLLHLLCDAHFPLIKLLVLVLQVGEAILQRIDRVLLTVVDIFRVRNDLFEELSVLVQVAKLALSRLKLHALLPNALLQPLDLLLML